MRIQTQKYMIEHQETAIVSGIITEIPHIVCDQKDRSTSLGWMHIREDNGIDCEILISGEKLSKYCKEHKEELSIGKRVRLRGMLSEGEGIDYMHLDNYGEITIGEEELTEDNKG
ncbi:MAG: hypothetical protein O3C05_00400 [Proteobacteria bacterium]|nr:hypothetical protein [Pseudomonadota bacterium]